MNSIGFIDVELLLAVTIFKVLFYFIEVLISHSLKYVLTQQFAWCILRHSVYFLAL